MRSGKSISTVWLRCVVCFLGGWGDGTLLPTSSRYLLSSQQLLDLSQVPVYISVLPADHKGDFAAHCGDFCRRPCEMPRDGQVGHPCEGKAKECETNIQGNQ